MRRLSLVVLAIFSLSGCFLRPSEKPLAHPAPDSDSAPQGQEMAVRDDLIVVESPLIGERVSSPLEVTGMARGTWFFEASFPVRLLDGSGQEIAVAPATSSDLWMTEDFISFFAELEFEAPETGGGTLILEKANASGLPEHDDRLEIAVSF